MMPLVLSALQLDFHTVIIKIQMAESKKLAFETGGHSLPQGGVNFHVYHL